VSQVREGDWRRQLRTVREIKASATAVVVRLGRDAPGAGAEHGHDWGAAGSAVLYYSAEREAFIVERRMGARAGCWRR
jgi:hypothetical protein